MKKYDVPSLRNRFVAAFPYRILPAHTDEGHFYQREDTQRVAASVTTKLSFVAKPYLQTWYVKRALEHIRENAGRMGEEFDTVLKEAAGAAVRSRDQAAGFGTTAHDAIDKMVSEWIRNDRRPTIDTEPSPSDGQGRVERRWKPTSDYLLDGAAPEEIAACRSFDKFLEENEVIPLASELKVWYEQGSDCYAGTIDSILLVLTVRKGREGTGACAGDAHDYEPQESGVSWCTRCSREVTASLILGDWKTSNSIKGKDEYAQQTEAYAKAIEKVTKLRFDDIWIVRFHKAYADYEVLKIAERKQAWKEWLAISRAYDARKTREDDSLLEPLVAKEVTYI